MKSTKKKIKNRKNTGTEVKQKDVLIKQILRSKGITHFPPTLEYLT